MDGTPESRLQIESRKRKVKGKRGDVSIPPTPLGRYTLHSPVSRDRLYLYMWLYSVALRAVFHNTTRTGIHMETLRLAALSKRKKKRKKKEKKKKERERA
jgi:hypothetical protein